MTLHFLDFDGTIIKGEVVREAYIAHCKAVGIELTLQEAESIEKTGDFWNPIKERFKKALPERIEKEVKLARNRLFWHFYDQILKTKNPEQIYEKGMPEVIKKLSDKGDKICIATLAREEIVRKFLVSSKMSKYVTHIFGITEFSHPSKTDILRNALSLYSPKEIFTRPIQITGENYFINATMTGDRPSDIIAGKAVGAKTCFVTWGNGELNGEKPICTANTPKELYTFLSNVKKGK